MSKAALSDFLQASAKHLGLDPYHGDTSSHPYVCGSDPIVVKKEVTTAPVQVRSSFADHAPKNPVLMTPSFGARVTAMYAARREQALRDAGLKP